MFDDISPKYDFLNHLLSFGLDFYWRKRLVSSLPSNFHQPVLDVATGTGDVGFQIKKNHTDSRVVGLDYSIEMVKVCKRKINEKQVTGFQVLQGDGEKLPFPNDVFSAITISFGFRNIGHYMPALHEFKRVLCPGGRLLILEFAKPTSKMFAALYSWYFRHILPKLASIFSRADAYRYLPESVGEFPERDELKHMILNAGFTAVSIRNLTFGVVTLIHAEI